MQQVLLGTLIGKLENRIVRATNRRAVSLLRGTRRRVRTVTVDHGTEFHGCKDIEAANALALARPTFHSVTASVSPESSTAGP